MSVTPTSSGGNGNDFESLLWRTGELLRTGDADSAAQAINQALQLRPRDSKARSLLGLVYFKIGKQTQARDIYVELAGEFPDDAGIHLNLGLVQLKLGAVEASIAALEKALALDARNERARQYLELAKRVRSGGGKLDDLESHKGGAGLAPQAPTPIPRTQPLSPLQAAVASAPHPLPLSPAQPVTAFAAQRLLRHDQTNSTFALAPGGALAIRVHGEIYTRTDGLVSSMGQLVFEPAKRRQRGVITDDPFGKGEAQMFLARGEGQLIAIPRGARFHALALDADILYVREDAIYAFDAELNWENGRAPGGEPVLVQFRGTGCVALRTLREPFCVKLEPEQTLFAEATALVGWIGRVVPRALPAEPGAPRFLECTGEGVLIYDDATRT